MKQKIDGHMYDTESAKHLGFRFIGEFGTDQGYEEQLFVTERGQHFLYGTGGNESPYPKPRIHLLTNDEAETWYAETSDGSSDGSSAETSDNSSDETSGDS